MKFNSQVCTSVEQSKRLLELGLKLETADMSYYILDYKPELTIGMAQVYRETIKGGKIIEKQKAEVIPAWSLHRLICMCEVTTLLPVDNSSSAYDHIIDVIEMFINNGYFNKEYLKQ